MRRFRKSRERAMLAGLSEWAARLEASRVRAAKTLASGALDTPVTTPAVARVMELFAHHGFAVCENSALVPIRGTDLHAEIVVLYADRRFVRLIRRILGARGEAGDAQEAIIRISRLRAFLGSPILGPAIHDIHG